VQVRLVLYGVIVPSLLFIIGCNQNRTTKSFENQPTHVKPKILRSFVLTDIDGRSTTLDLHDGHLHLSRVIQPILLLHFFSTRANLCRAMLPYLSDLQRKRSQKVFVLGITVPESVNTALLRDFMRRNDTSFFVSNSANNKALGETIASMLKLGSNYPLPLTILFDHGKYITHYEGITPIEMIRNDLNTLESIPRRSL
jgi:hypothetical protein